MQRVQPVYQNGVLIAQKQKPLELLLPRFLPDRFRSVECVCKQHGAYRGFIDIDSKEISACPICSKELAQKAEQEKQKMQRYNELLSRIDGLSKKYTCAGFKNFELTEKNTEAFNRVLAFAKEPKNTWLLLLGKNGTGKTHLSHAVLKMTGGIYREFGEIANELLDAQHESKTGQQALIKKYGQTQMLVIDEIDKVKDTEGRIGWLNDILRTRYNELLPTILVGNIDLEMLCSRLDLHGSKAIKDRIEEVGEVILCNWESYRQKLRKEKALLYSVMDNDAQKL